MTTALLLATLALAGAPAATVDLATTEGIRVVDAEWRYHDVRIVETDFKGPDANGKPNGAPIRAYDFTPHAGAADFDDSAWEIIPATSLEARRSNGRLSFNWYRLNVRVPERIGAFDPSGSTAVFQIVVDDYAEVWVDGQLPRELGQTGGSLVAGWNAPNRLVIGRNVRPGQRIQLAIFGINGPLSDPPPNYIWIRSASLEFFGPEGSGGAAPEGAKGDAPRTTRRQVETTIRKVDAALDAIVDAGTTIEKLAEGFQFTEGPVWLPEGALLFSDPNANRIYRWSESTGLSVFREQSGYSGSNIGEYKQPGSNGLALDPKGRLTIDQHGNRQVTRLEADGRMTVVADRYQGKRLNSPNDLVYRSDGTLYFTDPPFGLPKVYDDPRKELDFSGIFRVKDGRVELMAKDLKGPNGLAFSPDERFLYVSNWDERAKIIKRYEVRPDLTLSEGTVFFDMTMAPGEEALDGLKTDQAGNVYSSGPGGVWIISPQGRHLGTIAGRELPANMAWGDADGRTLYLTARTGLYRIRLKIPGYRPTPASQSRRSH
jgi:gluconolactonase